MVIVKLDRRSVNMGDDGESHITYKRFLPGVTLGRVLEHVYRSRYLPLYWNDRWDVWIGDGDHRMGRAIASLHTRHGNLRPTSIELAQPGLLRRRLSRLAVPGSDGAISLYFDRPFEDAPPPRLG